MTAKTSRRRFTAEFKTKVVLAVLKERQTLAELAEKHEIHPTQLTTWKRVFMEKSTAVFSEKADDTQKSHADEIEKLYAQIGRLQVENTFLKKIIVDKTSTQRKAIIEKEHTSLSVERQCELMEVSRSSFYYTPVEEIKENLAIMCYLDE